MASSGSATLVLYPTLTFTPEEIAVLIALEAARIAACEKQKRDECEKEWEDALAKCKEELSKPNPKPPYKPRKAGPGWGIFDCAKGFVTEDCGGNKKEHAKKKKRKALKFN